MQCLWPRHGPALRQLYILLMSAIRPAFAAIAGCWSLIEDFQAITHRLELLAEWTIENGPLSEDETMTIRAMIDLQIALGDPVASS